jgi:transcriptional regulator with XRE-family HTH domain
MLTTQQIRMARGALRWSAQRLSDEAGVALKTIQRIESLDGVPPSHTQTLQAIQQALEAAGIEFIGSPTDAPGIRLHGTPAMRQSAREG